MQKLKLLDLFSGIGGFSLGLEWSGGFETVAFCEIEDYPRKVLARHWPEVPCYEDVRQLTAERLAADGIEVDAICGGFPCQDLSTAGKQAGIEAERSGLWGEFARLIGELRPRVVFVENVANLISGPSEQPGAWFGKVLGDLATLGYDAEWHCIPASALGAAHHRDRVWIVAYPHGQYVEGSYFRQSPCIDSEESRRREYSRAVDAAIPANDYARLRPHFDGLSEWMDELRAYGNSVYPRIPEIIGRAIMEVEANS